MVDMSDTTRIENKLDEIIAILTTIMLVLAINDGNSITLAMAVITTGLISIARYVSR